MLLDCCCFDEACTGRGRREGRRRVEVLLVFNDFYDFPCCFLDFLGMAWVLLDEMRRERGREKNRRCNICSIDRERKGERERHERRGLVNEERKRCELQQKKKMCYTQ